MTSRIILDILKKSDQYVSGEEISRRLGVSRTAIWKHIKKLRAEGYKIISATNKGYMLAEGSDIVSPEDISSLLNTEFISKNIRYLHKTDSTNEEAKRNFDMPDGTLFIADVQTAGKGRLGRRWSSPDGTGIWLSLLLRPDIAPESISELTLIAGIAVCRALGCGCRIKWPNDIIIGSRKVCGILTEMSAETDRINYIVCGIGINVNTPAFPPELENKATSLFIETGVLYERYKLIAAVMNELEPLYKDFKKNGFVNAHSEYKSLCATLGKDVRVIFRGSELTGRAVDISQNGGLIVETDSGSVTVTSGEVSVRGIYGYI